MCGIVAYFGKNNAIPLLINGLKRLEYRGYDSAGIALIGEGKELVAIKKKGKIKNLENAIPDGLFSNIGIAHTRWATHGEPNDINAHPHTDCKGEIAVVHNGIIENFRAIKDFLIKRGHIIKTDTDTEVIAHLIEENYDGDLLEATRIALNIVEGTYGIAVISSKEPDKVIIARNGSPIAIAQNDNNYFAASDASAIVGNSESLYYLKDKEICVMSNNGLKITTLDNIPVTPEFQKIEFDLSRIEKGGFPHFMLKEIYEQPEVIMNTIRGRIDTENGDVRLNGLKDYQEWFRRDVNRIIFTACGTSWHASLIAEYFIEKLAGIPVEVEYASEFRYRNPIIDKHTAVFVITQSGETADTLAALREAKKRGANVFGICNVVGSTIARETDAGIYVHAGPEIGVASTKAFTAQIVGALLIAVYLGRMRNLSYEDGKNIIENLLKIPGKVEKLLKEHEKIEEIVKKFKNNKNFLYLGRGFNFPIALEGALKMKEISYIHAEGYPAAEMKHGPIALIDENMPVIFIATKDSIYEKVINNIEEVKARKGKVIAIGTKGDRKLAQLADYVIYIPETIDVLTPILTVIPLQLMAYYAAVLNGCNVDQPRNLAKSVTVE
ncbi:MAG TPA: glutamine--fructose-6-phosphate transaminase (isomerizing) [Firmicutes bacterium]|uniref:Glutamine--fructose-6-phosphate aminotransferase [isomerizing] n=1 Tax=candidate division TA06 bacterium TaxID=2250710 RepID=A0A660S8B6_UNCT6|nr:MAG: glutamine--fructose-6-phosphate transaminase (isomerizing) [candidate division TA06 bacterium]HFD04754.1 glutamine--fructose-6-phosphate transaminase (isomerizing) [Bacillota bacterium]